MDPLLLVASVILGVIIVLLVLILVISFMAAGRLASPPRKILKWTPKDLGLEYEDFTFKTT